MKHKKIILTVLVWYLSISSFTAYLEYKANPYYYGRPSGILELALMRFTTLFALFVGYSLYRYIGEKIEKYKIKQLANS